MKFQNPLAGTAIIMATLFATTAHASFIGAELQARYFVPDLNTQLSDTETFTVTDPGVEVTSFPNGETDLDFSATNLLVTYNSEVEWANRTFNGFIVEDVNNVLDNILGVSLNSATNMADLDSSRISFTDDSFSVNWSGLRFENDTVVSLDFRFESAQVPEPATFALLGLGFAGMVVSRRRVKA